MPKTKAKTKTKKTTLLLIHPQNLFCKVVSPKRQQQVHDGELCVPGAWEDMKRVAKFVERLDHKLNDIHVTMDSRHLLHVSHPLWFRDAQDRHPEPFTVMQEKEGTIVGGRMDASGNLPDVTEYATTIPHLFQRTLGYLRAVWRRARDTCTTSGLPTASWARLGTRSLFPSCRRFSLGARGKSPFPASTRRAATTPSNISVPSVPKSLIPTIPLLSSTRT